MVKKRKNTTKTKTKTKTKNRKKKKQKKQKQKKKNVTAPSGEVRMGFWFVKACHVTLRSACLICKFLICDYSGNVKQVMNDNDSVLLYAILIIGAFIRR